MNVLKLFMLPWKEGRMKKKNKSPKPRYITIKIQYYPLPWLVIIFPSIFIGLFVLFTLVRFLNQELRIKKHEVMKNVVYESPMSSFWQVLHSRTRPESLSFNFRDPGQARMTENIVLHGSRDEKQVALTFDADMTAEMEQQLQYGMVESYYNKAVIDILNQTKTKATLFLTGMWIEMYPHEAFALAHNPLFELGSHSYSHPSFAGFCYGLGEIPDNEDNFQLQKTQELLKVLTGFDNLYFRFPGGCYSQKDLGIIKKNNLLAIQWDVAGEDGFNYNADSIIHNVVDRVQNGSIIVLHMHGGPNAPMTAQALPAIISTLKERGFEFVKVSELLNYDEVLKGSSPVRWLHSLRSLQVLDGRPSPPVTP